ncbi:MAG: YqiA/YcfP family alpha/beta fold hydrolase [Betaproteobacteria bacterium]
MAVVYIHGFNSSALSFKARLLRERMAALGRSAEFHCPELDHRPSRAIAQLETLISEQTGRAALIGSSLGGYYATWLAEKHDLRAALINPAVRPYELLGAYVGPQRNLYTGAQYEFTEQHLEALRALETARVTPERYLLIVGTADEVLDYRTATVRYRGCREIVVEGGDHGLSCFAAYVGRIVEFCEAQESSM